MYKLKDRKKIAEGIKNCLQSKVYGEVGLCEESIIEKFVIYIKDRDIYYKYDISEWLYKIELNVDCDECVEEIFQDYKRTILGKYIV